MVAAVAEQNQHLLCLETGGELDTRTELNKVRKAFISLVDQDQSAGQQDQDGQADNGKQDTSMMSIDSQVPTTTGLTYSRIDAGAAFNQAWIHEGPTEANVGAVIGPMLQVDQVLPTTISPSTETAPLNLWTIMHPMTHTR